MFDISFTEILVVAAASLSTLGIKGSLSALKSIKKSIFNVKESFNEYLKFLEDSELPSPQAGDNILDEIVDLDGNLQKRYDISKIMPQSNSQKDE